MIPQNFSGWLKGATSNVQATGGWRCLQVTKHRSGVEKEGSLIELFIYCSLYIVVYMGRFMEIPKKCRISWALIPLMSRGRTNIEADEWANGLKDPIVLWDEEILQASCALEDAVYNLMRPLKTLRIEVNDDRRKWEPRTSAITAGLADHVWTIEELMRTVVVPEGNDI